MKQKGIKSCSNHSGSEPECMLFYLHDVMGLSDVL